MYAVSEYLPVSGFPSKASALRSPYPRRLVLGAASSDPGTSATGIYADLIIAAAMLSNGSKDALAQGMPPAVPLFQLSLPVFLFVYGELSLSPSSSAPVS